MGVLVAIGIALGIPTVLLFVYILVDLRRNEADFPTPIYGGGAISQRPVKNVSNMLRFLLCFLFWLVVFHWWLILRFLPEQLRSVLDILAFMQILFWINFPGLPLASLLGEPHFTVEEFGALPSGPLAYTLIVLFWTFVAVILAVMSSHLIDLFKGVKNTSNRQGGEAGRSGIA